MLRSAELRADLVVETIALLERRIGERFAGSGLARVAADLLALARSAGPAAERLRRPIWPLRLGAALGAAGIVAVAVALALYAGSSASREAGLFETLQGSEAALNVVVLLAMAIYFMGSLEMRVKRRQALAALHRLRSLVHIVDMHQLTKDPYPLIDGGAAAPTPSSPSRTLTRFELARYLDYCSELFSLASKVAALHVQYLADPVVLEAVNDIESLSAELSSKVWQKIVLVEQRPA